MPLVYYFRINILPILRSPSFYLSHFTNWLSYILILNLHVKMIINFINLFLQHLILEIFIIQRFCSKSNCLCKIIYKHHLLLLFVAHFYLFFTTRRCLKLDIILVNRLLFDLFLRWLKTIRIIILIIIRIFLLIIYVFLFLKDSTFLFLNDST